jgi:Helix-turn-helix
MRAMDPFCRAVYALRRARAWTPTMLAAASGIPVATIRAIERGDRWCDPATGDALIRAFVQGDSTHTWLAILCARTFAVQWNTMTYLAETDCAGEA